MQTTDTTSRPKATWAQIVSAACSCVALLGLYGLWHQANMFNKQEQRESDRRVRDAYGKLYTLDIDLWKFAGQNPKIAKALIDDEDGAVVGKMTKEERGRFDVACQMAGDMFEYYLLIEPDLDGNEWASRNNCWKAYMEMLCQRSPGFREYIKSTEPEWTDTFLKRFKELSLNKKTS